MQNTRRIGGLIAAATTATGVYMNFSNPGINLFAKMLKICLFY